MPIDPRKWLFRQPSDDAAVRLFLFPYSGTGASMYRAWPERAGSVEICPVQIPARENRLREPHPGTVENLARAAAEALAPFIDRRSGFFGHCGGATTAFATALELERVHGRKLNALFVSSQLAPHEPPLESWLRLDRDGRATELGRLAEAMGSTMNPDFLEMALDVLEQDLAAFRRYQLPRPEVLACAVHVVGWKDDAMVGPERMRGWNQYSSIGRYHEHLLDGGHYRFLDMPPELLELMDRGIAEAWPGT
jgi:surfactin synthase thioesterase subunit